MTAKHLILLVTLALSITVSLPAVSQSGNGYDLTWHTVDNGGAAFNTGDGYQLGGAIGQPDAGTLSSGDYILTGGFWQSGSIPMPPEYHIYLPLVLRNSS